MGASSNLLVLALACGCNSVYGIGEPVLQDGPDPDRDHDGVPNESDDCPDNFDPDQKDIDSDTVGDACDNCPLIANADQGDLDLDQVGDACDSHPQTPGECLVLLDLFDDPSAFSANWSIVSEPGDVPMVHADKNKVRIVPNAGHPYVGIVARDPSGALYSGPFDVVVIGAETLTTTLGGAQAVTELTDTTLRGASCGAIADATGMHGQMVAIGATTDAMTFDLEPQIPFSQRIEIRFLTSRPPNLTCRIDFGISVGAGVLTTTVAVPQTGGSGVLALYDPIDVAAVALYQRADPCVPVVR